MRLNRRLLSTATGLVGTLVALSLASPVAAQSGGTAPPGSTTTTTTTTPAPAPTGPPGRAKLRKDGTAVAPSNAPPAVQAAIAAGNAIHTYPYRWGGGHRTFYDTGYDCSGAVSYVLHGAGLLSAPMASGGFMTWGDPGKGSWITTYSNPGHMYVVVAGLRFDTSSGGDRWNQGSGPRWRKKTRKPRGFVGRHYSGY